MQSTILMVARVGAAIGALAYPWLVQAQSIISSSSTCNFTTGKFHADCIPAFIGEIIQFFFGLTGLIALLIIIVSGYQVALAKVMGQDTSEGYSRLRAAIIGFIICALSWYIVDFLISIFAG
jgi:hypothetical protein